MEDINNKVHHVDVYVKILECNRCFHTWIPRKAGDTPVSCPKCHSVYYNRPRIRPIKPKKVQDITNSQDNIK